MSNAHSTSEIRPPNHLAGETSPYLLQHAHNPVDWYPWSPEALEKARLEDKPIFLSIGYSACHWCHVMERESFENESIAALLNASYVSIKVDREERPDLDEIYMAAVQLLSGQGGWPMSVWLTPGLKPFFGGTYFPPEDWAGRPGFRKVLERLAEVYKTRRDDVESGARGVTERIASFAAAPSGSGLLSAAILAEGASSLKRSFDPASGGFGGAPKFPHPMGLRVLLRQAQRSGDLEALQMVTATLDHMAMGGIYDHLGGGFHRYSTDARWLVPHFEKMLYDQALLTLAYTEALQVTQSPVYERIVRETLDFVRREMTSPEGGFYATLDADSGGSEGTYYTWTPPEVLAALGEEEGSLFCRAYEVDEIGSIEGRSVLHSVMTPEALAAHARRPPGEIGDVLAAGRVKLLAERERRIRPERDEKILAGWNGLVISAMARAGIALDEPQYVSAAGRAMDLVLSRMQKDGRLLRVFMDGRARVPAYLEDYAAVIDALVDLYEAAFEARWLPEAERLAEIMIAQFGDRDGGGFFGTGAEHADLIVRPKNAQDGSTPSGNSSAAGALLRLGRLLGRTDLEKEGERTLRAFQGHLERMPGAFHQMLLALDLYLGPRQEIVLAGSLADERTRTLLEVIRRRFLPRAMVVWADGSIERSPEGGRIQSSLIEGKTPVEGKPAAYVCRDFVCLAPVTDPVRLDEELARGA